MTRTRKYPKFTYTRNCQCSWCNPARARAEYLAKRAKKDFYMLKMTNISEAYDYGHEKGMKDEKELLLALFTLFVDKMKDKTANEIKNSLKTFIESLR